MTPMSTSTDAQHGAGAESRTVLANGVELHYLVAGTGQPVLLLPGWPQDAMAWRNVAPRLVGAGRRTYVLDPRGFGGSEKPNAGYDLDTAAADVHAFLEAIESPGDDIDVVSHDLGSWIAYAHACAYPADVKRLVLSEVTLPGARPPAGVPDDATNVKTFHFGFNRLDELPEALTHGRERIFLDWLFDRKAMRPEAIDEAARDHYARVFGAPGAARAGFEYYRKLFSTDGLDRMKERFGRPLPMPVLAVGAQGGVGDALVDSLRGSATDLDDVVLAGCGHYLLEESPAEFAEAVLEFWHRHPATEIDR